MKRDTIARMSLDGFWSLLFPFYPCLLVYPFTSCTGTERLRNGSSVGVLGPLRRRAPHGQHPRRAPTATSPAPWPPTPPRPPAPRVCLFCAPGHQASPAAALSAHPPWPALARRGAIAAPRRRCSLPWSIAPQRRPQGTTSIQYREAEGFQTMNSLSFIVSTVSVGFSRSLQRRRPRTTTDGSMFVQLER